MTWEEFTNSDFYKESHHDEYRETRDEKEETLMREYLADIDAYRESTEENESEDPLYDAEHEEVKTIYFCYKMWNGRIRGILKSGTYEECRKAKYNYDLACIDSDWDYGMVKRIEYHDEEELEEIRVGIADDVCYGDYYGDYDEEY